MSFKLKFPTVGRCKRRAYDRNLIAAAYADVKTKNLSVAKAAKRYGIPESTLRDRTLNLQPVDAVVNPGPNPTFSKDQESILVYHVMYMATIGYEYNRKEFLNIATDYAISLQLKRLEDPSFKQSWYGRFKVRHPEIAIDKKLKLSLIRAQSTSAHILDSYFGELEQLLEANGVTDHPNKIWNLDETILEMEQSSPTEGATSNPRKNVTIIAAGNAAGTRLPPYYIFPGRKWSKDLLAGASPGSSGSVTESGCSNSLVLRDYFEKHFIENVSTNGLPLIVLFDGHSSYVNLTLSDWASEHNIKLFVIPPHTSNITQTDDGFFGPLKNAYYSECEAYVSQVEGRQITNHNVAKITSRAYNTGLTPENLIESFRKAGIYPIDRTQIRSGTTAPFAIDQEEVQYDMVTGMEHDLFFAQKIVQPVKSSRKRATQAVCIEDPDPSSPSKKAFLLNESNMRKGDGTQKEKAASKKAKKATKMQQQPIPQPSTSSYSHDIYYTDSDIETVSTEEVVYEG